MIKIKIHWLIYVVKFWTRPTPGSFFFIFIFIQIIGWRPPPCGNSWIRRCNTKLLFSMILSANDWSMYMCHMAHTNNKLYLIKCVNDVNIVLCSEFLVQHYEICVSNGLYCLTQCFSHCELSIALALIPSLQFLLSL